MVSKPGGNHWERDQTASNPFAVVRGKVPGSSVVYITASSDTAGPDSLSDMWGGVGDEVLAVSGEQWEAFSTSSSDNPLGSGAAAIDVPFLDVDYGTGEEIVFLDGVTPVTFTATNKLRAQPASHVCELGSGAPAGGGAIGDITVRVAGGGSTRAVIPAGLNASQDGFFTVPADHTAYLWYILPSIPKNGDADIVLTATTGDNGIFIEELPISVYQGAVSGGLPVAKRFEAKSDIILKAQSTNDGSLVRATLALILEGPVDG